MSKYPALLTELATGQVAGRGRETGTQIAAPLGRSMDPLPAGLDVVTVSNDGALEDTVGHALTTFYPEMS